MKLEDRLELLKAAWNAERDLEVAEHISELAKEFDQQVFGYRDRFYGDDEPTQINLQTFKQAD